MSDPLSLSLAEWQAALNGWLTANGHGTTKPPSADEFEEALLRLSVV